MTEKLDVVMLTKNSERYLNESLKSVFDNVPVNRLIVVDGFSTDKTHDILDHFGKIHGNVKVILHGGTRAEARTLGIREVETDWFAFVDSDVALCPNWFKKAKRYLHNDVGAVWGVDVPGDINNKVMVFLFKWMETRVFSIRGGCHDILIRQKSVEDIIIPKNLHTLEDSYIKDWIAKKNYRVLASLESYCRHYKTIDSLMSKENVTSTFRELKTIKLVRERLMFGWIFCLGWFLQEVGVNRKNSSDVKKQGYEKK